MAVRWLNKYFQFGNSLASRWLLYVVASSLFCFAAKADIDDLKIVVSPLAHLTSYEPCELKLKAAHDAKSIELTAVKWVGKPPAPTFFEELASVAGSRLRSGDVLLRITFDNFGQVMMGHVFHKNGRLFFNDNDEEIDGILIEQNGQYEERMMNSSLANGGNEVLGVRITSADKKTVEVPIFQEDFSGALTKFDFWVGSKSSVSIPPFKIDKLIDQLRSSSFQLDTVEISHFHNLTQVRRETRPNADGKNLVLVAPFNAIDLKFIQQLSARNPLVKFVGRAVTPDGFNYSVTVQDGRQIFN